MTSYKIEKDKHCQDSYLHMPYIGALYKITFQDEEMVFVETTTNFRLRICNHTSFLNRDVPKPLYQFMKSKNYNFSDHATFHVIEEITENLTKFERLEKTKQYIDSQENIKILNYVIPLEDFRQCPHGKAKITMCRVCMNVRVCSEHDRVFSTCKICNKEKLCSHGNVKSICKQCGGNSICNLHGRIRSKCVICSSGKSASICEHKRLKFTCKDCKGSGRCDAHNRRKEECKICSPWNFCKEHQGSKRSGNHNNCTFETKPETHHVELPSSDTRAELDTSS